MPRAEATRGSGTSPPPVAAKSVPCPDRRRTSTPTSRSPRTGDDSSPPPDAREPCASGASATGKELLLLDRDARTSAPVRAVIGVDVSPDGSRIATASVDGSARIFDAETGRQLAVIRGRHCIPASLSRQPRGLQPGQLDDRNDGADATVRIFDTSTGRQLRVLRGHAPGGFGTYPVAWSPDGARLLSDGGRRNPHLGCTHRPTAARAAAHRRPRAPPPSGARRGRGAPRVGPRPRRLGRVERSAAAHAGDERGVVRHGVQPRRVAPRATRRSTSGVSRIRPGTGPQASRP